MLARRGSPIARQLPLALVQVFVIGIEHALAVAIERPHDADARHHCRRLVGLALAAGIVGAAVGSGLNACVSHSSIMTDSREPLKVSLSKKTE
jgi:hypothetical protein